MKPSSLSKREFFKRVSVVAAAACAAPVFGELAPDDRATPAWLSVKKRGARGDGVSLDTRAVQSAIDLCGQDGGGTVYFPPGRYLSGTLVLRTGVRLYLDHGATLVGSANLEDYPSHVPELRSYTDNYTERSLLYGEKVERVAIEGRGVIDGQGAQFKGPYKVRPYGVRLIACRQVRVNGVTFKDSPMWVQHYLACDDLSLDGLTVRSRCNHNNDGIDIDGCHRVRISHCDIVSGDDAIVLKSTLNRACRDVTVSNCILSSDCNAFKLGTESNGGFENIVLSNCTLSDTRLAGIAIELVDGGILERVNIGNVVMRNVNCPIFVRLGHRARPFRADMERPALGRLRQVRISQVQADGADSIGCSITGLPQQSVEDVALDEVRVQFRGGGTKAEAQRSVPEVPEKYPEYSMFGALPAYGFYCRHAKGVRFTQVHVGSTQPDERPALMCDDVEELDLNHWHAPPGSNTHALIRLKNTRRATIRGCRPSEGTSTFLRVEGARSEKIFLAGNDLSGAATAVSRDNDVPAGAVRMDALPRL